MINKGLFTSNSSEWGTPQKFYEELDREFQFELDVCSSKENHKCDKYFTIEDNGLSKTWGGTGATVIHLTEEKYLNG